MDFNLAIIIGASSYQQFIDNMEAVKQEPLNEEILQVIDECWQIVMPIAPAYGR